MVAERDGRVIGWAGVSRENHRCAQAGVGEYTIYVDRDARGSGVGGPLLDGVVARAQELGYWKLIGRIFATNESSRALALRCGFYEVGLHPPQEAPSCPIRICSSRTGAARSSSPTASPWRH
jgi:phosphinothricin acetyltransferase